MYRLQNIQVGDITIGKDFALFNLSFYLASGFMVMGAWIIRTSGLILQKFMEIAPELVWLNVHQSEFPQSRSVYDAEIFPRENHLNVCRGMPPFSRFFRCLTHFEFKKREKRYAGQSRV